MINLLALFLVIVQFVPIELRADIAWQPVAGPGYGYVYDIEVHPEGFIIASTQRGFHRSYDDGVSWSTASTYPSLNDLAIHPDSSIYAGGYYGVFRSVDQGESFQRIALDWLDIESVDINAAGDVFAATWDGMLYRSTYPDDNFQLMHDFNIDLYFYPRSGMVWVDPSQIVYFIGMDIGVFRSNDNGNTWEYVSDLFYALSGIDMDSAGGIFVSSWNGAMLRSLDDCETWEEIYVTDPWGVRASILVTSNDEILVGGGGYQNSNQPGFGIHKSDDQGSSWTLTGQTNGLILCLQETPEGTLLAGTRGGGIIRSVDDGDSWLQAGLGTNSIQSLCITENGHLLAGAKTRRLDDRCGIFLSDDAGNSWSTISTHTDITSMITLPNGDIYATSQESYLYQDYDFSDDKLIGLTDDHPNWQYEYSDYNLRAVSDPGDGYLYLSFRDRLERAPIGTSSWEPILEISRMEAGLVTSNSMGDLFLATDLGLGRSNDSGISWTLSMAGDQITTLFIDNSDNIYVGSFTDSSRLDISYNDGESWENSHVDSELINTILSDGGEYLYMSTTAGVYRSNDLGQSWLPQNVNLPESGEDLLTMVIDTEGYLYLGFDSLGIYRSTLPQGIETKYGGGQELKPSLIACYPNPLNPSTYIKYSIPKQADLIITVYDLVGRQVWSREITQQYSGEYTLSWNGTNQGGVVVSSGVYIVQLVSGQWTESKKVVVLK